MNSPAVKNEIPQLLLGAVIDIPTGQIAQRLGVDNDIVRKALCCLVEAIDIKNEDPDSGGIASGLVPVQNPCNTANQDCGVAHKLYFGLKNRDCPRNIPDGTNQQTDFGAAVANALTAALDIK